MTKLPLLFLLFVCLATAALAQSVGLGLGMHEMRYIEPAVSTPCANNLIFDYSDATGCNFLNYAEFKL